MMLRRRIFFLCEKFRHNAKSENEVQPSQRVFLVSFFQTIRQKSRGKKSSSPHLDYVLLQLVEKY